MSDSKATTAVNLFMCGYLAAGVFGGLIADWLGASGNYVIGVAGALIWSVGAVVLVVPFNVPLDLTTVIIGLALTAVGYGIINPTQVVFVGSQVVQKIDSERVVAYLYFSYNVGNLAGEFSGPILRQTYGPNMALLASFVAVVAGGALFIVATPFYRNTVFNCACSESNDERPTPNDEADAVVGDEEERDKRRVINNGGGDGSDAKETDALLVSHSSIVGSTRTSAPAPISILQICLIAIPMPIFFAILYQTNSTIVDQATLLNDDLFGWSVPPDIMASLGNKCCTPCQKTNRSKTLLTTHFIERGHFSVGRDSTFRFDHLSARDAVPRAAVRCVVVVVSRLVGRIAIPDRAHVARSAVLVRWHGRVCVAVVRARRASDVDSRASARAAHHRVLRMSRRHIRFATNSSFSSRCCRHI